MIDDALMVWDLSSQGFDVIEIATRLSLSTEEVEILLTKQEGDVE